MRIAQRATLVSVLAATTVLGISAAASSVQSRATARTVPASDWTTYHHDELRTGDGAIHGSFHSLKVALNWRLPTSTPATKNDQIYSSPLIVGHVAYVTTLENRVYAVSTTTHKTIWSRQVGQSYTPPGFVCGDIGPTVGIVSTPVIDEGRGELFVVADVGTGPGGASPAHRLFGLALKTGKVLVERGIDPPGQQVIYLLQRASLAISKGHVVVGFGGNDGDCGPYHGWIVSVPETGSGPIFRYEVASGAGQGRGAVWMGGGAPTVDAAGNVYVADGNGNATAASDRYDFSDAVLKLSPSMHLLDWFAPATWYQDNAADADLGSGAPQLLPSGQLLQVGKTNTGYVLNHSHLGHVNPAAHTFGVCSGLGIAFGGDAIAGSLVVVPCQGGLDAVRVLTKAPWGSEIWSQSAVGGPPVVAAGSVWAIAGASGGSTLYELNAATGAIRHQFGFGGEQNHFATPAVGDNMVFVASTTQLLGFAPS